MKSPTPPAHPECATSAPLRDGWREDAHQENELATIIGGNVRRFRKQRGWSLEQFGRAAKVSRAMLGQIELSRSVPTITVLWKIARALDVPISTLLGRDIHDGPRLMPAAKASILTSASGRLRMWALCPADHARKIGFHEMVLQGDTLEDIEAQAQGTLENLVVCQGAVEVFIGTGMYSLIAGDAIFFSADVAHSYRNPHPTPARCYVVTSYAEARYRP